MLASVLWLGTVGNTEPVLEGLKALYHATGGPSWVNRDNWLTGSNPWQVATSIELWIALSLCAVKLLTLCAFETLFRSPAVMGGNAWSGVQCMSGDKVTYISLPYNNLQGTLPTELLQLQDLAYLNLGSAGQWPVRQGTPYNLVGGMLPEGISQLPLTYLSLTGLGISGTVPAQLANMTSLAYLDIGDFPPNERDNAPSSGTSAYGRSPYGSLFSGTLPPEVLSIPALTCTT
jgi:hypothetical protein